MIHLADEVNEGNNCSGIFFKEESDIDISSLNWFPIGKDERNVFSGNFDGGGYKITGLNIPADMSM